MVRLGADKALLWIEALTLYSEIEVRSVLRLNLLLRGKLLWKILADDAISFLGDVIPVPVPENKVVMSIVYDDAKQVVRIILAREGEASFNIMIHGTKNEITINLSLHHAKVLKFGTVVPMGGRQGGLGMNLHLLEFGANRREMRSSLA